MRRDVVNALTRVRRDLRFQLADRYRALLGSRFVVLTALAAGVLDQGMTLLTAARRWRTPRHAPSPVTLVRAAVTGGDELSLIVSDAPAGTDGVALRRGTATIPLSTTLDHGSLLRALATLPAEVCDGDDWTVALTAGAASHEVVVADPAALATRLRPRRRRAAGGASSEPHAADWPPRLRADGDRLVLRAAAPVVAGITHTVEVGVRSAVVSWPSTAAEAGLVLVAGETERRVDAVVADGDARAVIDLRDLGEGEDDATWFVFVADGRAPLMLPRGTFPLLDDTGRPHRVPLPTRASTGRAAEVGYTPDNQLVVRVGNFAPAAS